MLQRLERHRRGVPFFSAPARLLVHVGALLSLGLAGACGASPQGAEPVADTEQAIENGDAINDPENPVIASWFPVFTVGIGWPDGKGGFQGYCTGTIIAPDLVLTAAHCQVNVARGDAIIVYPVGKGLGNMPTGTTVPVTSVAVESGVNCSPSNPGWPDITCWSTEGSGTTHYADLAVLTLATPFAADGPYQPIGLRPPAGGISAYFSNVYAVGRGYVNYQSVNCSNVGMPPSVSNGNAPGAPAPSGMYWKPAPPSFFPPGTDSTTDQWTTSAILAVPGDSGGPMIRWPPLGQFMGILGVLSSYTGCNSVDFAKNTYTSVVQTDNYNWLKGKGAILASNFVIPPDPILSFGAAE